MYKIIGADQNQYGPVSTDQLRQWIAQCRVNGQTLTQREGTAEWKPLASYLEFSDALATMSGPPPMPSSTAASPETWATYLSAYLPDLQIGSCLSRSWRLLTENFGLLFGASFLVWLINLVVGLVPFLGWIIHPILRGVLFGGLYLVFLKRIRGQPAVVRDVFAGFRLALPQLMLVGFLTSLLSGIGCLLCVLPGIYLAVAWALSLPLVIDKRLEFWTAMELSRKVVTRIWFQVLLLLLLAFLPVLVANIFAVVKTSAMMMSILPAILESGRLDFAQLMDAILQVAEASLLIGVITKLVLLINLPFAVGALMYAYEDLFGARTARAD